MQFFRDIFIQNFNFFVVKNVSGTQVQLCLIYLHFFGFHIILHTNLIDRRNLVRQSVPHYKFSRHSVFSEHNSAQYLPSRKMKTKQPSRLPPNAGPLRHDGFFKLFIRISNTVAIDSNFTKNIGNSAIYNI